MSKISHISLLSALICFTIQGMDKENQQNSSEDHEIVQRDADFEHHYNKMVAHHLLPQLNPIDQYVVRNSHTIDFTNYTVGLCAIVSVIMSPAIPILYAITSITYKHHFRNMQKEWDKEIAREVGIDSAIKYFKEYNEFPTRTPFPSILWRIDNAPAKRAKNLEEYKSRIEYIQKEQRECIGIKKILSSE